MSFSKFLISRVLLKQFIIAILLIIVLAIVTLQGLKRYTHHGEANPVPDFSELSVQEATELAKQNDLQIEIADSTHARGAAPGAIVDQIPRSGFKVKKNRTVFITINSTSPEKVTLPKLKDISIRQAKVLIENCGLQLGETTYKPSEYNDLILEALQDSVEVTQGQKLIKGSTVDLVVGRSRDNISTTLPDLTGLILNDAKNSLNNSMLNMGVSIYDESVQTAEDSTGAFVWKQHPNVNMSATINRGSSVDIWLTTDSLKIVKIVDTEL